MSHGLRTERIIVAILFAFLALIATRTYAENAPTVRFPGNLITNTVPRETAENIAKLLVRRNQTNLEQSEIRYQKLVQARTLSDLAKFYTPENQSKIRLVYASFTPEGVRRPEGDLGFGLHVVKRLTVSEGGVERTIDINELWPEDRTTGGLFLPDEIRVKSQVFDGNRKIEGSHQLYYFDLVRVAWGPGDDLALLRQTRFSHNTVKTMRVPVSAPYSCQGCHQPDSGLHSQFLTQNEKPNFEAIVQDSQFQLPYDQMKGFREYIDYLKHRPDTTPKFVEATRKSLLSPDISMRIPRIREQAESIARTKTFSWLSDDGDYINYGRVSETDSRRQGVYRTKNGSLMVESIEDFFEGKYRWWEPLMVVPGRY